VGSGEPIICALLLKEQTFPFDDFLARLSKTKITGKPVKDVERSEGDIVSFTVGDELFALALMPAPYPASDLEGPIATSSIWPPKPPINTVKQHRSHLLITMMGGNADAVRRRLALTAVTGLAASQDGVMAVYWPEATHLVFPPVFTEMAESINSPDAPPLHLWVDMRAFKNEDGTTGLFTTGLSPLGHMEFEIPSIEMDPGELREWLINIMYYVMENGPVLKHGQTIGMTADQQIRIRHVASSFGHAGKVIRLDP
jgi:hypothetical protein